MSAIALARTMAAATPASRVRYLDFLRALSILVVVCGHWLLAVVVFQNGELQASNLLAESAAMRALTWLLQVMPVFFLVGGYVNLASWESAAARGVRYGDWLARRSTRLLRPAVVLLGVWVPLVAMLGAAGMSHDLLRPAGAVIATPLWFLATYVVVVAAVPVTAALHRRFGAGALTGLVAAAALVDVAHHALGLPVVGWTNFIWVWLAVSQLGYLWRDGTLRRSRWTPWLLVGGGLLALVLLVGPGPYPVSMVGADDGGATNNSPPTVALVALGAWQTGLVLLLQDRGERWLRRPRVWALIVGVNSVGMTLYLWHLTALILVVLALVLPGLWPSPEPLTLAWWALRPLWLLVLAAVLAPLVALFGRVERRALTGAGEATTTAARAVPGCAALALGVALLVEHALANVAAAALVVAGAALLGAFSGRGRSAPPRRYAPAAPAASRGPRP
jgi:peptidoglycan/LPS O-acetylase OafA/YrhL